MAAVNCTVPFIPSTIREGDKVCGEKESGKIAANILYTSPMRALNLWSPKTVLTPPCIFYQYEVNERYHYDGNPKKFTMINGKENMRYSLAVSHRFTPFC